MPDATTHLLLPYILAAQAQKHVTHNEALRLLDGLVQLSVLDRDLTAPPGSPADGDRYIVASGATGAWTGWDLNVALWTDGTWLRLPPRTGWRAWVEDESLLLVYDGAGWVSTTPAALQNLSLLGLGTTADPANPFSVKLNDALWTARYTSEGGSGDLRYKLNKESSANTLSLLMQSGWSGRAELGLAGDDDFVVKVSPDGAAWKEALRVAKDASAVASKAPTTIQTDDGLALSIDLQEGPGVFQATRYANGPNAPVFFGRKARGTREAPAAVQAGDTLLGFRGYGYTGAKFLSGSAGVAFLLEAAETYVEGTNYGTQIRFLTTAKGSTANLERVRIADSGDLQMGGANTVINASRHPVLRAYTVATLPSATPAGQLVYVSDGASNKRMAVSDGSNWRWPDGAIVS